MVNNRLGLKFVKVEKIKAGMGVVVGLVRFVKKKERRYERLKKRRSRMRRGYSVVVLAGLCVKLKYSVATKLMSFRSFSGREGFSYVIKLGAPNCVFLNNLFDIVLRRKKNWQGSNFSLYFKGLRRRVLLYRHRRKQHGEA